MKHNLSHLSYATQDAIAIFRRHHAARFYTDRMLKLEDQMMRNIPDHEMAEYVRITTEIQNQEV